MGLVVVDVRGVHFNRGVCVCVCRSFLVLFNPFISGSASRIREIHPCFFFCEPVCWCHCGPCCTRSLPYGQLGPREEKGILHKTQIVSGFQTQHCCLSKKNELKIRAISIRERGKAIHR